MTTTTATQVRTAAARAIEAHKDYAGDIIVAYTGVNASDPVLTYSRGQWAGTPFQSAGGSVLRLARWLWAQGGCCTYIAAMGGDGSATVYEVEFAEESDEDTGTVAGEPVDVIAVDEVDASADDAGGEDDA